MHHPVTTSLIVGASDIYSNVLSSPSKTFYVFSCPEKMSCKTGHLWRMLLRTVMSRARLPNLLLETVSQSVT
eukprot:scaffold17336_cov172-Skeletonema_dohrnii-CCMP3373.AAC.4